MKKKIKEIASVINTDYTTCLICGKTKLATTDIYDNFECVWYKLPYKGYISCILLCNRCFSSISKSDIVDYHNVMCGLWYKKGIVEYNEYINLIQGLKNKVDVDIKLMTENQFMKFSEAVFNIYTHGKNGPL